MRLQTLFPVALAMLASTVSAITPDEAVSSMDGLTTYLYDHCKTPLVELQQKNTVDRLVDTLFPPGEGVASLFVGLQERMTTAKALWGDSWDGVTPLFSRRANPAVTESYELLILGFHECLTELIDVYEYSHQQIAGEIPVILQHLRDLNGDGEFGRGAHTLFNRIGYWMDPDTQPEAMTRVLTATHIALAIDYYARG